jgi:2-keto-3-deoxy-L-rhamnonate aldolase RhmA
VTMIVTFWLIAGGVRGLVGGALDLAQTAAMSPAAEQVDLRQLERQVEGVAQDAQQRAQRITPRDAERASDDIAMGAGFALLGLGLGLLAAAGGAASTAKS